MRRIITFLLSTFLFVLYCYPYQFEDYKWGDKKKDILDKLNSSQKIFFEMGSSIGYLDTIAGHECMVKLIFSPKSEELASIELVWDNKDLGERLKAWLIEKYGEGFIQIEGKNIYHWKTDTPYDEIVLEYEFAVTKITYYGGKFYSNYLQELDSLSKDKRL